jgi:hypothetical protein
MLKPTCTNSTLANFKISTRDCKKYKINITMSNIPLSQWSDIDALVDNMCPMTKIKFFTSKASYDKYIAAFSIISTTLVRHPGAQSHASQVLLYLKNPIIKDEFELVYKRKVADIQQSRLATQEKENQTVLNSQTRIMSQFEVRLENQKKINHLQSQVDAGISDHINDHLSTMPQQATRTPIQSTLDPKHIKNIKEVIFNDAVKIHDLYKSNAKLPEIKLEEMALGLSCIVDLGGDSQTSLFSSEVWSKLVTKYRSRFLISPTSFSNTYKDKWNHAKQLYSQTNGMSEARKYFCRLQLQNIRESDSRMLDFFQSLISLHQGNKFMLDTNNESKVSERDYLYQLWLPIFRNLFNINNSTVRIKTGETVLEGSSEAKAALYDDQSHVIGFKIDLRVLVDIGKEELDLVCGEGCLQSAEDNKIISDRSKLLREGKEIEMGISEILDSSDRDLKSQAWCLQYIGKTCHFSTVHVTKHGYHVNIPQFSLSFPYSFFNSGDLKALDNLFSFRDNVEQLALVLKQNTNNNQEKIFLAKHRNTPSSPSRSREATPTDAGWYTPPYKDNTKSKVPHHIIYESSVESSGDDDDDHEDESNIHADTYGFVRNDKGWYSVETGATYDTHPYHF